ncbi:MAG: hypothetical protein ACXVJD_13190 [Mucilaginibacter sp.]
MKFFKRLFILLFVVASANGTFAQNNGASRELVKEGMKLNEERKYAEAIDKYNQALKIDTGNLFAGYQLANSSFLSGKGKEGIPYLERIVKADSKLKAAAYDLLGLIFFSNKQYAEAEASAIEAIKLDSAHASTQRMYALVCFHQNKRAAALLGFCSFILLEPNTSRSAEAFSNIQHILQGGVLKPEPGDMAPHAIEAPIYALNQVITQTVGSINKGQYTTAADLLAARLKAIFINIGQLAEKQTGDDFFRKYMAAYFYRLAQSTHMPAFVRLLSSGTAESDKWIKDNPQQMADLATWIKTTERSF